MSVALDKAVPQNQHMPLLKVRWEFIGLPLITLVAGVLRFYRLGDWSYWRDETYTLRDAIDLAATNGNYPLWYIITHFSITSLGMNEWSARFPAAVVGTLAIPLTYALVRRVNTGIVALLAALFLAVSPWHLYWSQNARFYILVSLLTSLALLIFYLSIEEDRPSSLVGSLLLFGLAALAHPTALLVLVAAGTYLLTLLVMALLGRSLPPGLNRRNLTILAGLTALPVVFLAWRIVGNPTGWTHFLDWPNNDSLWLSSVAAYYLTVPIVCMAAFGAVYWLWRGDRFALLLVLAAVIPIAAIIFVSSFTYTASRYMFVSAVPWLILAARGAGELLRQVHPNAKWLGLGVIVLLTFEPLSEDVLYYLYQNGNRFDYRGAYRVVQERMRPGDVVLSNAPELGAIYLKEIPTRAVSEVELTNLVREGRRAWLVTDVYPEEVSPQVNDWVKNHTILVANLDVHARARNFVMRVYLFDPAVQYEGLGHVESRARSGG